MPVLGQNPSPLQDLTAPLASSSPSLSLQKVYRLFLLTRKPERLSYWNRSHSQRGLELGLQAYPSPSALSPALKAALPL